MEFEKLIGHDNPPIDIEEDNEDQQPASRTRSRAVSSREDPDPEEEPHFPDNMLDGRSFEEDEGERCIQHWSSHARDHPEYLEINLISFGIKAVSSRINSDFVGINSF